MRNIMGTSALIINKESDKLRLDSKMAYSDYQLPQN